MGGGAPREADAAGVAGEDGGDDPDGVHPQCLPSICRKHATEQRRVRAPRARLDDILPILQRGAPRNAGEASAGRRPERQGHPSELWLEEGVSPVVSKTPLGNRQCPALISPSWAKSRRRKQWPG